jgi:hemerythrin-like domain-containing protein
MIVTGSGFPNGRGGYRRAVTTPVPLPKLPPVGGETTGRNVVDVIGEQHDKLLELCDRLVDEGVDQKRRFKIADVVVATLSRHLSAEEQYLYPAVRAVVPDGDELADRELEEDHALLVTLKHFDATRRDDSTFGALAVDIAAAVRRHVEADDAELFPVLLRMAPVEDLIRVGNRIETAEEAAPTRPHPSTPARPPWNKVVDPAVAVVDKIRDVAGGRTTYAKDL